MGQEMDWRMGQEMGQDLNRGAGIGKKERAGVLCTPRLSCEGSRSQRHASCGYTGAQIPSKRQTDCVVIRRTSAAARESAVGCPVYLARSASPWLGEWLAAWYGHRIAQGQKNIGVIT